jgi:hypothetical protein
MPGQHLRLALTELSGGRGSAVEGRSEALFRASARRGCAAQERGPRDYRKAGVASTRRVGDQLETCTTQS